MGSYVYDRGYQNKAEKWSLLAKVWYIHLFIPVYIGMYVHMYLHEMI